MWYLDREVDIDIDIIVMYTVYRTKMLNFSVFVGSHISSIFISILILILILNYCARNV